MFKSNLKRIVKLISDQKGASLVIVALSLVVIMGFASLCVDLGGLYKIRREMVTAADAASLAGARELWLSDEAQAKNIANNYAVANLAQKCNVNIKGVFLNTEPAKAVEVTAIRNMKYNFAKVMGFDNQDVYAHATAIWMYPLKLQGVDIFPIFYIKDDDFYDEQVVILDTQFSGGNWGLLDMGSGKSDLNEIWAGESCEIPGEYDAVEDTVLVDSEPGNAVSRISYIEERLQAAADPDSGVDVYGYVPIVEEETNIESGKTELVIIGFAKFRLDDVIKEFTKNDSSWYAVGSPYADPHKFDEDNEPAFLYGQDGKNSTGFDKKDYADDVYPKGAIIGKFVDKNIIKPSEVIEGTQSENYNYGSVVIKLIE